MTKTCFRLALAMVMAGASSAALASGTLVVSGDEWQLSNSAYGAPYASGTTAFVNDLAITFSGNNYLFLTGNGNVPQAQLSMAAAQFQSLGKTITYTSVFDPLVANGYDAVFHFGQTIDNSALGAFVSNGGSAYVSLGSGWYGTAAAEAAAWNPVLNQFGLVAGDTWFPGPYFVSADVTVGPTTSLLWGYGQSIEKLSPNASSQSYIRGTFYGGPEIGLVGASKPLGIPPVPGVPEPASWAMLIAGFGLVGMAARRRRAYAAG